MERGAPRQERGSGPGAAGPQAQSEAKLLIRAVAHRPTDQGVIGDTAKRIARVRATPEGKEGVAAFLAKRKPTWVPPES